LRSLSRSILISNRYDRFRVRARDRVRARGLGLKAKNDRQIIIFKKKLCQQFGIHGIVISSIREPKGGILLSSKKKKKLLFRFKQKTRILIVAAIPRVEI
jgi:hypothetical protein